MRKRLTGARTIRIPSDLKSFGRLAVVLLLLSNLTVCSAQQRPPKVVASPKIPDAVVFPDPNIEFIIGPQLKMGSKLNPYPWFDRTQLERGKVHGRDFPKLPPLTLTGTLVVTRGSAAVQGIDTHFLSEIDPDGPAPFFNGRLQIRESDGKTYQQVQVRHVDSDSQLTLTTPYAYSSQSGVEGNTGYSDGTNVNNDVYMNANYYDLGLSLYGLYYRTGDERILENARKVADSWWLSPAIKGGTQRNFDSGGYSPRSASIGGLILRALDGRPEMWDWLRSYARFTYDIWIKRHVKEPQLYGVRDGSYMLLYATWLGKVLPDSFPLLGGGTATDGAKIRAGFMADAEEAAVNYYGRLQYPDGSWRWDDAYYKDADGGYLVGIMQPFMVGLLMEALVDLHRATTKPSVKENIKQQLMKACKHLYADGPYRKNDVALPGVRWRSFQYFYHGGTSVNPTKYEHGDNATATATWEVASARQLIATSVPTYGYVYQLTGDESFKTMGDELFEAAFGDAVDGIHDEAGGTAKNYNQNYRMGGRYLVWRLDAANITNSAPNALSPAPTVATKIKENEPPKAVNTVSNGELSTVFEKAKQLSEQATVSESQIAELVQQIESSEKSFEISKAQYTSPETVLSELDMALRHARNALLFSKNSSAEEARTRVAWAAARLKRANDHLIAK